MPYRRKFPPVSYIFLLLILTAYAALAQEPAKGTETAAAEPDGGAAAAAIAQESENKPAVAAYVTGDVPDYMKTFFGTYLLTALINNGADANEETSAAFLAAADEERSKRNNALNDSLICELGRKFGLRYICVASITPVPGAFTLSARIMSSKTGKSRFGGETSGPLNIMEDLERATGTLTEKMFGGKRVFGGQITPEAEPEPAQTAPTPPPAAVTAPPPSPVIAQETVNVSETVVPTPNSDTAAPTEADDLFRKPIIEISVGLGGLIAGGFGGGFTWKSGERVKMPYSATGIYLYFDAVYAELSFGYANGNGQWDSHSVRDPQNLPYMPRSYINAGLFAKYPFNCYERVKLFPLLGLDYEASISGRIKYTGGSDYIFDGKNNRPDANALSSLWFKFGGGIDFDLGKTVYLRSEWIYGLRAANAFERFGADKLLGEDMLQSGVWAEFGQGMAAKICVGAKF